VPAPSAPDEKHQPAARQQPAISREARVFSRDQERTSVLLANFALQQIAERELRAREDSLKRLNIPPLVRRCTPSFLASRYFA
jgi:hypothetical protein